MRAAPALLAGLAFGVSVTAGEAQADWTAARVLGKAHTEQVTAAIGTGGGAVVAWIDERYHVQAAAADGSGRFSRAQDLGKGFSVEAAVGADGTATVVWALNGELRFARRPAHGRFGPSRRLAPKGSKEGDDQQSVIARPDGSTVVVYESPFRSPTGTGATRLRVVDIDGAGRPGLPVSLGRGRNGLLAVSTGGDVVLCCQAPEVTDETLTQPQPASASLLVRRADAASFVAVPLPDEGGGPLESLAVGATGAVALGFVDVENSGDAGTLGTPFARLGTLDGGFGAPRRAPVRVAHRAFGPLVQFDESDRLVLLWQEKTRSTPFSRAAPLHALVRRGAPQTLDRAEVVVPAMAGDVVVWVRHGRWRSARLRGDVYVPVEAPRGAPEEYGARDLAAARHRAVLAWAQRDGTVRVSMLRTT